MSDEIARGVVRYAGDASELKSATAEATAATKAFEKTATTAAKSVNSASADMARASGASYDALSAQSKRFLATLERQALVAGKTRSEAAAVRADQLHVAQQAAPFIQRLRQAEEAQLRLGLSAKQLRSSMRLVPAQMTDIVTSIASGMPIWLVAIQQGGQLKDSFGGIIPTLKALASFITLPKVAIASLVAGIGGLIYGSVSAQKETENFNEALIMTGRTAGFTADQLSRIATEVAKVGGTQGAASDVLTKLIGTANVDPRDMQRFGEAITAITRSTNLSVEDTVKAFNELGKDPVKASDRLNESMRYLSASTKKQIMDLTEQGRAAEAARVAQNAFADAILGRSGEIERNIGLWTFAWRELGAELKQIPDFLKNIFREKSLTDRYAQMWQNVKNEEKRLAMGIPGSAERLERAQAQLLYLGEQIEIQGGLATRSRLNAERQVEGNKALSDYKTLIDKVKPKQDELNATLKDYARIVAARAAANVPISAEQQALDIKNIRAYYSPKGKTPRSVTDDAATRMIQNARQAQSALRMQIEYGQQIGQNEQRLIEFNQQIADLKTKKILTADDKSLLASEGRVRKELEIAAALEKEAAMRKFLFDLDGRRNEQLQQQLQRLEAMRINMEEMNRTRREGYERQLEGAGTGEHNQRRIQESNSIIREFDREYRQLQRMMAEGVLPEDKYREAVTGIRRQLAIALSDHATYYTQLEEYQRNWAYGASDAINNYLDKARNVAKATEEVFSNAFQAMEDFLTEFVSTGKLSFSELGTHIVSEINRMLIRMYVIEPMARSMSSGGGPLGSIFSMLFPAALAGAGGGGGGTTAALGSGLKPPSGFAFPTKFASGGVFGEPTQFTYGRGKRGVLGEAGYEAVMPVSRGPDGKLGVKAVDAAPQQMPPVIVQMTVVTQNAETFRRSEGQIKSRLAGALHGVQRFA